MDRAYPGLAGLRVSAIAMPYRQGTPAWVDARRNVLGSSDISIVTGNSPYKTSLLSLWAIKTRQGEPDPIDPETQELFDLGHAMEDVIADRYALITGRPVKRANRMLVHRSDRWMGASLDRVSARKGERRIIEVKWVPHRHWLTDGPEPVPAHVQDQVQWQLMVTGYDVADVAVLNGSHVEVHEVGPSDKYQDDLRYIAKHAFWDYVEAGEMPPVDGSESTRLTLTRMYPRPTLGLAEPTDEIHALVLQAKIHARTIKSATEREGRAKNTLRSLLHEYAGVEGDGWRVQFTKNKDSVKEETDWQAAFDEVADAYLGEHNRASVIAAHTTTTTSEGNRPLLLKIRDEETNRWI